MAQHTTSAALTDGSVYDVSSFNAFTVYQTTASGTGTPTVQISDDKVNWHAVGTFPASGFLHVQAVAAWARVSGGTGSPGVYVVRGLLSQG